MIWKMKKCGCVKTTLSTGRVIIRCERHRGKAAKKRSVLHWEDINGTFMVRHG